MSKLRELMSTKNKNIIKKNTALYIEKAFKLRYGQMYRHNENDECIVFDCLVFITCVSPICQYFEMILSVYYDVASTLK